MSLIVARKDNNSICIVSDTKLTYPLEKHPKLVMAPPEQGVIKCVIINHHVCISFACDDIEVAQNAIKECRKIYDNVSKILDFLLKVNVETNNGIEFIVCISLVGLSKIYEIRNKQKVDVNFSWIGSQAGYNLFQEKMHDEKVRLKKDKNDLSDLSRAMDEVIKSGKDETVNGFNISVSNKAGFFEYPTSISVVFPARTYSFSGSGSHIIPITHGTAGEGGYNVHIFSSNDKYDVLAIHLLQGNFGILYQIKEGGLLRPEIIKDVDEIEFSEITKKKYGIGPMGFTSSFQKSYFERGNKAFNVKDFLKAIEFYDLGLTQKELEYKATLYFNKGLALYNLRKFPEAMNCFGEAIKLNKAFEIKVKEVLYGKR